MGYTRFADQRAKQQLTLMSVMNRYRDQWMYEMLHREARIVDSNIVAILSRTTTFLASTTIAASQGKRSEGW
ncbi:MAG: DUF599 family protein [Candidatus Thiodiazotropha sp.]